MQPPGGYDNLIPVYPYVFDRRVFLRKVERDAAGAGVTHVLEGSVRQENDRLRIAVQLIDAGSSQQIWSESYDRPAGDILEIQSEVAQSVARELQAELSFASESTRKQNPYAYSLVIQARNYNLMIAPEHGGDVAEVLLQEGVTYMQGYLFGRPELTRPSSNSAADS